MNELQIRLSADITALQSALTKAKNTIKSFESETEKESEKGNVGFKRKIGLIEQLTNKAKTLRTALSQATNEQQVERFNQELEQTRSELTRLNALGRSVTANLVSTAGGFDRARGSASQFGTEFNRVIQDAPFAANNFGAIANNLTRLGEVFQQTKSQAGGTGAAIKASISAIVSPTNLALLAVSALTSAFTAYQLGAFDFIKSNKDSAKALEEFDKEIEETIKGLSRLERGRLNASIAASSEKIELDSLFAILKDGNIDQNTRIEAYDKLVSQYPKLLKGLTQEKALTGDLTVEYEKLTSAIRAKATANALSDEFDANIKEERELQKQLNKEIQTQSELQDKLAAALINEQRQRFLINNIKKSGENLRGIAPEVDTTESDKLTLQLEKQNKIISLSKALINGQKEEAAALEAEIISINKELAVTVGLGEKEVKSSKDTLKNWQEREDAIIRAIRAQNEFNDATDPEKQFQKATSRLTGDEGENTTANAIQDAQNQIAASLASLGAPVKEFADQYKVESDRLKETNRAITDSFGALGTAIAANLNISNDAVKGFVSTVLSNAPKLIQAIIAQAQASNRAADIANQGNIKQATGNAIVTATSAAKGLGPIGLAALPIFIGGALALISSAFGKSAGGGGSASVGSASAGAPPQIFTNSQIPSIPGSPAPSPSGNIDFDRAQGTLTTRVDGGDIVFVYDRYKERQQGGG